MKFKLIDLRDQHEENVEFGTCEFCMFVDDWDYQEFVFLDENNKQYIVPLGFWSWGDWLDESAVFEGFNLIDIADFVSKQDASNVDELYNLMLEWAHAQNALKPDEE